MFLALAAVFPSAPFVARAQMSEEQKRRLFLQVREDIKPVPKPTPKATPRPKPKPAATPSRAATPPPKVDWVSTPKPTPRKTATPKPTPRTTPQSTPNPTPQPTPEELESAPEPTPASKPGPPPPPPAQESDDYILMPGEVKGGKSKPIAVEESKPPPEPEPKPQRTETPIAAATPQIPKGKTPAGRPLDAPILIEKSGLQDEAGYEPPTKQVFGGFMKRWRYLTPGIRRAIDNAKVRRGRWKYIIVHNSGTRQGNARIFDNYHRRVRKMQNGLAYHFVIGNGNSSGDGQIEIGNRWTRQINGGHVASDYLNDIAIGICLVGDLNRDLPTKHQLGALDELATYLRGRVGKVKGRPAIVKGHKEINPRPTDCPGDRFPLGWLRKRFGN